MYKEIKFVSYGVKNSAGMIKAAIAEDPSDTIQISIEGYCEGEWMFLNFESEAYHLQAWAIDNNLEYSENEHIITHNEWR